jgi:recombination protein RecA
MVEIYGPESSGKTTLTLQVDRRQAQKQGGTCAFVDAEHALDPMQYAQQARRETCENLLISQPDTGEQALEIVDYAGAVGRRSTCWWWTRSPR